MLWTRVVTSDYHQCIQNVRKSSFEKLVKENVVGKGCNLWSSSTRSNVGVLIRKEAIESASWLIFCT